MRTNKAFHSLCVVLLVAACVHVGSADLKCTDPQKGFYMSYNALSNRDHLGDLFRLVDSKMPTYGYNYTDPKSSNYLISSMHPQLYYNEHHQKEVYLGNPANIQIRSTST